MNAREKHQTIFHSFLSLFQFPPLFAQTEAHNLIEMASLSEPESATELEALCKQDSSWYPCQVSLSSAEDSVIVDFGRQELEDMVLNKDEALMRFVFVLLLFRVMTALTLKETMFWRYINPHLRATCMMPRSKRVRHSTRVYCRCTFTIKWLHPDFEGQMVTIPSSSIMKLANKSISSHPTVAALLKSVKQMGLYTAPPLPIMHEDIDVEFEFDLNKVLEKQIEEINISAYGVANEITVDISEGVKANNNGHLTASKIGTKTSGNLEGNKEDEDSQPPFSSKHKEHSEQRSHISPLAARAALASLVSLTHKHIAISGTELFNSSDHHDITETLINGDAHSGSGVRKTRSTAPKGIQNSDLHDSTEAIRSRTLTNKQRLTRSAVKEEKDISFMALKQGSKEKNKETDGTDTVHDSKVLRKKNDISKKAVSLPLHSESNDQKENLTSGDLGATQDAYVQMKTSAKDTKSIISTNSGRLTRSRVSCKDNLIVPESHVVEKENCESKKKIAIESSQSGGTPGEVSNRKHTSGAVRKTRQTEGKMSGSGDNSQGQKRKSTSSSRQEQRFSPRLRFLPRTRSQNKS